MNLYAFLKTLHVLSATLMVGTGFGTAFYLFWANRSRSVAAQAVVATWVVKADLWFTLPTVVVQPVTGAWMMLLSGWTLDMMWIYAAIALYCLAGACWLPVVWLQLQMRNLACIAYHAGESELPAIYRTYQKYWERLGYPAFVAMLAVYFLMVMKPM
ncbi:MAG: DUF2269 domain-containing protein [Neisseria sp.]|nr:DUF2269 domain-containing protein [Neisseria sp.]